MVPRKISSGRYKSFSQLIHDKFIYVDKTKAACLMAEQEECYLLTRPRRMGKSTMVSTLEYLFSKGTEGTEGLYCYDHWRDPNRYFVFHFTFNAISAKSIETVKHGLIKQFLPYAKYFGIQIDHDSDIDTIFLSLVNESLVKLSDHSFIQEHPELQDNERHFCTDKVVLLIDEYDAPLTLTLDNRELFDDIKELYRVLFSTLKNLSCFRLVFLTGVSSYAQTSIFSGANQFKNISLNDEYATCCGYTQDEIEHYFAPELENAKEVLDLDYDELMAKLSYFYDGYLFTQLGKQDNRSKNVFSPVSVSSFLTSPINGFINYWSTTGAQSSFLLKLLKLCSKTVKSELLKRLYPDISTYLEQNSPELLEFIESCYPVLALEINVDILNIDKARLIQFSINRLTVKLNNISAVSAQDAIAILFQSGYLGIKYIKGQIVYLGLANIEVARCLAELLTDDVLSTLGDKYNLTDLYKTLFYDGDAIFASLHEGGDSLAKYLNLLVNVAPVDLFAPHNRENVVTFIIFILMRCASIAVSTEVQYVSGRSDLVVYKPDLKILVEDTVIEFKLARQGENILTKLAEGTKQVIDKRYGLSVENPNPYRYCVVFSNDLRQVGAIEAINADGSSKTVYISDKLNEDGTVNSQLLPSKE